MQTANTILLTTTLLSALCGCAASVVDEPRAADQHNALPAAATAGLSERPKNPTCVAGEAAQVPQRFSQLGCFDAANPSKPGPGLVPYDVNAPLWTEDADKQRWLAIPDGTTITVDAEGHFVLPKGAVLLKTFARDGQRLETRVWMNHPDAGWRGYSYRWSADGSDALLAADAGEQMPIGSGAERWTIPARGQCGQCHQPGSNQNLGLQLAQLDRDFTYPSTGLTANQLDTLTAVGVLVPQAKPPAPSAQHKLVDYRDVSQPVESRARAYLHANCSSCHNAAEGYCTGDFRIGATEAEMGVCDKTPNDLGERWGWLPNTKLVAPGDPERSALWLRLSAPGDADMAMPPLGRHEVHQEGVELIAAWISGLRGCKN
jgi:uncharacterized repeat protein (TIGR03806 family)